MKESTVSKLCPRCSEVKPLSAQFWKRRSASQDGFASSCKACTSEINKRSHSKHLQADLERMRVYRQSHSGQIRASNKAWRERSREHIALKLAHWDAANPGYRSAYVRAYYQRNKSAIQARVSRYRVLNAEQVNALNRKRHAVKVAVGGVHTAQDVAAQLLAQNGKCYWCQTALVLQGPRGVKYQVDHIFPLQPKQGPAGSNAPHNICISCPTCNYRKKNQPPHIFAGRLF